jgi:hypothetical protein
MWLSAERQKIGVVSDGSVLRGDVCANIRAFIEQPSVYVTRGMICESITACARQKAHRTRSACSEYSVDWDRTVCWQGTEARIYESLATAKENAESLAVLEPCLNVLYQVRSQPLDTPQWAQAYLLHMPMHRSELRILRSKSLRYALPHRDLGRRDQIWMRFRP